MDKKTLTKYKRLAYEKQAEPRYKDLPRLLTSFTSMTTGYIGWIESTHKPPIGCVDFFIGCMDALDDIQGLHGMKSLSQEFKSSQPDFLTACASWISRILPTSKQPPPCKCNHADPLIQLCHIKSIAQSDSIIRPSLTEVCDRVVTWLGVAFHNKAYTPYSWPRNAADIMPLGISSYVKHTEAWMAVLPHEVTGVMLQAICEISRLEKKLYPTIRASRTMGPALLNLGHKIVVANASLRGLATISHNGDKAGEFNTLLDAAQRFDVAIAGWAYTIANLIDLGGDLQLENFMGGMEESRKLFKICRDMYDIASDCVLGYPKGQEDIIEDDMKILLGLLLYLSPTFVLPPDLTQYRPGERFIALEQTARARLAERLVVDELWIFTFALFRNYPANIRCYSTACKNTPRPETLKRCGACHLVNFCDQNCQRAVWKRHKVECPILHEVGWQGPMQGLYDAPLSKKNVATFRKRCEERNIEFEKIRLFLWSDISSLIKT